MDPIAQVTQVQHILQVIHQVQHTTSGGVLMSKIALYLVSVVLITVILPCCGQNAIFLPCCIHFSPPMATHSEPACKWKSLMLCLNYIEKNCSQFI